MSLIAYAKFLGLFLLGHFYLPHTGDVDAAARMDALSLPYFTSENSQENKKKTMILIEILVWQFCHHGCTSIFTFYSAYWYSFCALLLRRLPWRPEFYNCNFNYAQKG